MSLDDLELLFRIFSEFRVISQIWKATTVKRMEIKPYTVGDKNCSPLNVLFSDTWIAFMLLG